MKYSMFSWFGYLMPFKERIKVIAEAGFDGAMIAWEDEQGPWPLKKDQFPEIVRQMGLEITNIHAPFMGYNDIWQASRLEIKAKLRQFQRFIKDCHRFDIPVMVLHTNDLDDFTPDLDKGRAFFSELVNTAEKYGVDLALENVSRQDLLEYLLNQIDHPRFGMCYDSSHDFLQGGSRGRILKAFKGRIKALHLSDNDCLKDRHWIPGQGRIPFDTLMPEIRAIPSLESISYEVIADKDWQEKKPLAFAKAVKESLFLEKKEL